MGLVLQNVDVLYGRLWQGMRANLVEVDLKPEVEVVCTLLVPVPTIDLGHGQEKVMLSLEKHTNKGLWVAYMNLYHSTWPAEVTLMALSLKYPHVPAHGRQPLGIGFENLVLKHLELAQCLGQVV